MSKSKFIAATFAALALMGFVVVFLGTLAGNAAAASGTASHRCSIATNVGPHWANGSVRASYYTSCAFARVVSNKADRLSYSWGGANIGRFAIDAWSSVTHRWYTMRCELAPVSLTPMG
jgi:hypothetical protein